MKRSIKLFAFFMVVFSLVLFSTSHNGTVFASIKTTITAVDPTPLATLIEATATVDPDSIGNTSGVIAIGMIVVIIILAGVIWGSLELRQDSLINRPNKE